MHTSSKSLHEKLGTYIRATEGHAPYEITQCDLPPNTGKWALLNHHS